MVAHVLTALMSCAKAKATSVSIAQRRCSFRSCHADAPLLLCGVGYDHDAPVQSYSGLCPAARLFFTGDGPGGWTSVCEPLLSSIKAVRDSVTR
jgi:hypothetical protein